MSGVQLRVQCPGRRWLGGPLLSQTFSLPDQLPGLRARLFFCPADRRRPAPSPVRVLADDVGVRGAAILNHLPFPSPGSSPAPSRHLSHEQWISRAGRSEHGLYIESKDHLLAMILGQVFHLVETVLDAPQAPASTRSSGYAG